MTPTEKYESTLFQILKELALISPRRHQILNSKCAIRLISSQTNSYHYDSLHILFRFHNSFFLLVLLRDNLDHTAELFSQLVTDYEVVLFQPTHDSSRTGHLWETTAPMYFSCWKIVNQILIRPLEPIWDEVFAECSTTLGKDLSKRDRQTMKLKECNFVYGEVRMILPRSNFFCFILRILPKNDTSHKHILFVMFYSHLIFQVALDSIAEIFWSPTVYTQACEGLFRNFLDLGSGTGRGLVAAALLLDIDFACGYEILPGLHDAAVEVLDKYIQRHRELGSELVPLPNFEIQCLDFFAEQLDWAQFGLIYANSTCFDDPLMARIAVRLSSVPDGHWIVTNTTELAALNLQLVLSKKHPMSWGSATVHYHQKLPECMVVAKTPEDFGC